jgi:hypothetical protein
MQKIKQFLTSEEGKDLLLVFIIILVGLISFGLGRLSKNEPKGDIKIEYIPQKVQVLQSVQTVAQIQEEKAVNTTNNSKRNFVASNRGKKYYPANCSAGKSIKEENRIYFETKEEAERKGYELSSSCK